MPVPGWRLRISLQASMPSRVEVGWHADVADDHVRRRCLGAVDEPVVVLGDADDLEVVLARRAWPCTPSRMKTLSSARKTVIAPMPRFNTTAAGRCEGVGTRVVRWCQPHPSHAGQCPGACAGRERTIALTTSATIRGGHVMRIERSITTVSWIPSDLMEGMGKMATRMKLAHHDPPPPDALGADIAARHRASCALADRFRFANQLRAFIEVDDDGRITDCGYCGGGVIGATTVGLGVGSITIPAVKLPDRQSDPEVTATVGDVHADRRRSHRRADAACREAPAVRPVPRADRVDHAGADDPRRRHARGRAWSAHPASRGTGCSTTPATWSPRAASPSTSSGWPNRSAGARRGATRTRRRWSPRSRRCWSASCRRASCAATRSPTSAG